MSRRETVVIVKAKRAKKRRRKPAAVKHNNMRILEDMIASCMPWGRVLEECARLFDVSETTVYEWSREIHRRWEEAASRENPHRRAIYRARLDALYHRAWEMADLNVCEKVAKLQAKLDGLDAPVKIQLSGVVAVAALTPQQRRAEIDEMLERRRLAAAARELPAKTH